MSTPLWIAAVSAVVGAAALGSSLGAVELRRQIQCDWANPEAPRQIRALSRPLERMMNLPGLGDYLSAVAWIESRGNPRAGSSSGNAARGWFGMRPESARVAELGLRPDALKDGPTSVGLAAWYIERCIKWASPGQRITWLALRRCWGYPKDTDNVNDTGSIPNLTKGLVCVGVDPGFMNKTAIRWRYTWPGIVPVMRAVGRPIA